MHSTSNSLRGIVSGILSGDSLIVRFVQPCDCPPIQVVCLQHLVAPKFGRSDGKIPDEPHGFASWNYMRDLCIGQRVLIPSDFRPTEQKRHHGSFGELPTIFTRVTLVDSDNQDVGILAVTAGWVKLRPIKSPHPVTSPYLQHLTELEEQAKSKGIGVWAPNGFVRPVPVHFNPNDLLNVKEFDAIIENVKSSTNLSVFLLPNHENIVVRLAGVRPLPSSLPEDTNLSREAVNFVRNNYLDRLVRLRLHSIVEPTNPGAQESVTFLGCFLEKYDSRVKILLSKGLALFNHRNAEYCPFPEDYARAQSEAIKSKNGIWNTDFLPVPQQPIGQVIKGTVLSVRCSNSLCILTAPGQRKTVVFSSLSIPRFSPAVGSEPLGFEAREFLRSNLVGEEVQVVLDGAMDERFYGTVYNGTLCINELLAREGFATLVEPCVGRPSLAEVQIKAAEDSAKAKAKGVHSPNLPKAVEITDFTYFPTFPLQLSPLKTAAAKGIIEQVSSGSRFSILLPELMMIVRVGLNGLLPLPVSDRFGSEAKAFCQRNFLQREVSLQILDVDRFNAIFSKIVVGTTDVAEAIFANGLAEIHPRAIKTASAEYIRAQQQAKGRRIGVWSDPTRHPIEIQPRYAYPVNVVAVWDAITLTVQFDAEKVQSINNILSQPQNPLTAQPMKNDGVIAEVNNKLYRARVENVDTHTGRVSVTLLEHGQNVDTNLSSLFEMPPELKEIPPLAMTVRLAWLEIGAERKEDTAFLWKQTENKQVFLSLVCDDLPYPKVLIMYTPVHPIKQSLNEVIRLHGSANYVAIPDIAPEWGPIAQSIENAAPVSEDKTDGQ